MTAHEISNNYILASQPYNYLTNPKNFLNFNFHVFHHEFPIITNIKRHFRIGRTVLSHILTVQNITKSYVLLSGTYAVLKDVLLSAVKNTFLLPAIEKKTCQSRKDSQNQSLDKIRFQICFSDNLITISIPILPFCDQGQQVPTHQKPNE